MADQSSDTRAVEEAAQVDDDALEGVPPGRDGGPVDEADMAAADGLRPSPDTAAAYQEALRQGARQRGEGRTP